MTRSATTAVAPTRPHTTHAHTPLAATAGSPNSHALSHTHTHALTHTRMHTLSRLLLLALVLLLCLPCKHKRKHSNSSQQYTRKRKLSRLCTRSQARNNNSNNSSRSVFLRLILLSLYLLNHKHKHKHKQAHRQAHRHSSLLPLSLLLLRSLQSPSLNRTVEKASSRLSPQKVSLLRAVVCRNRVCLALLRSAVRFSSCVGIASKDPACFVICPYSCLRCDLL